MGTFSWRRLARTVLLAALLWPLTAGPTQAAAPPVVLPGHVPSGAISGAQDLGALVAGAPITLTIALAAQQPASLAALVHDQYTPGSAYYHQFLTPAQFATQFGASDAQLAAVSSFLRSEGLTLQTTAPDRLFVGVTGSANQVDHAFGVALHQFRGRDGVAFAAPTSDPHAPAALAGVIKAVHGLTTLPAAHPHLERRGGVPAVRPGPDGKRVQPAPAAGAAAVSPGALTPTGLTPADIRSAYDLAPATSAGINGAGQTLGLFEADGYTASDVAAYEQQFGLRAVPLQNVLVDGFSGAAGSSADEVTLDIELQIAVAPGANQLRVYEGPNTDQGVVDTYAKIANEDLATSISTSWGQCEPAQLASTIQSEAAIFQQMAAQGQTIFAAAGDQGAFDCGGTQLAVDDPASDPWMTGVGGTHLDLGPGGAYGAETAWDDQCASGPCAGGGGLSQVWTEPTWQTGPGVQNQFSNGKREVPDVALDADPATGYAIYYRAGWVEFGGTSAAAPLWAGWSALSNQYAASHGIPRLGFASPSIYRLASSPQQYPLDFHDVGQGSNEHYPATPDYDLATGWGSYDGWNLLRSLNGASATAPAITMVSPSSGPPTGGTSVTISGVNFGGATAVKFGTVAAASFAVTSATSMTAVTPAEPQGVVDVSVTTPSGTSGISAADRFAFIAGSPTTSQAVAYQINPSHSGATQFGAFLPTLLQQWSVDLGGSISYPLIAKGKVYVTVGAGAGTSKRLVALDETTGHVAWQVPLGGLYSFVNAAYDAGRLFTVNSDGLMQAFDGGTGVSQWSVQLPNQYIFSSAPTAANGVVYVGGAGLGGTVYAVNEANGAVLWTAAVENGDSSSPAVTSDGVYVSYSCPQVYKFAPASGALDWHFSGPCEGGGGRTPVQYQGQLFVRDEVGTPQIFADQTGQLLGSFAAHPAPAFVGNTRLALDNATLEATDNTTGILLWSFTGDGNLTSAPIVINQTVYVGSGSGALYALDVATGRQVWTTNVGAPILAPDEHNEVILTGLGAGEGLLVVPAGSKLVAYASTPGADVGGHDLQLTVPASGQPALSWTPGGAQTGYLVARWSSSGVVLLPPGSTLPASATGYTDSSSLTDSVYCYATAALNGSSVLGLSDVLCDAPNVRSASGAPPTFSVQLDQTDTATLTWTAPVGQDGYTLTAVPLTSGAASRTMTFSGAATSATDNTGGTPTCYYVVPTRGGTALGNSDVLCALPGQSTLPFVGSRSIASRPAPSTPGDLTTYLAAEAQQLPSGTLHAILARERAGHGAPGHAAQR